MWSLCYPGWSSSSWYATRWHGMPEVYDKIKEKGRRKKEKEEEKSQESMYIGQESGEGG